MPFLDEIDDSRQTKQWLRRLAFNIPLIPLPTPVNNIDMTDSLTHPAPLVAVAVAESLKCIYYGSKIWERLYGYTHVDPFDSNVAENLPNISRSWDMPGAPEGPPAFYKEGLSRIRHFFSDLYNHGSPLISDNASGKEVMDKYIHKFLDACLMLKYENVADSILPPSNYILASSLEKIEKEDIKNFIFYPTFGRPMKSNLKDKTRNAAGYSDKVLLTNPRAGPQDQPSSQKVATEGKTTKSYPSDQLRQIFAGSESILAKDNTFFVDGKDPENLLLQQMWGECTSLGAKVAIASNTSHVFVLIHYDGGNANETGFIVSPLMKWTDPRLLTCLMGLCYIAIDIDKSPNKTIQDILCPGNERQRILRDASISDHEHVGGGDDGAVQPESDHDDSDSDSSSDGSEYQPPISQRHRRRGIV